MLSKKECEAIIGKTIRNDTYAILCLMCENKSYAEAYKIVDKQRDKYNIGDDISIVAETTIKKYFPKIKKYLGLQKISDKTYGIYGIYVDDELIYIGLTMTSFQQRYNEHKGHIRNGTQGNMILYPYLRKAQNEGRQIELRPLISNNDLKTNTKLERRNWEDIELGLITLYKPICNQEGRTIAYVFSADKRRR